MKYKNIINKILLNKNSLYICNKCNINLIKSKVNKSNMY